MARSDLPRIQGNRPTMFNYMASAGAVLAGVAGFAAATFFASAIPAALTIGAFTFGAPLVAAAGAAIVGGLIGGAIGKGVMRRDAVYGRQVNPPSIFNKGLANGLFVGGLALLAAMALPAFGVTALAPFIGAGAGAAAIGGVGAIAAAAIVAIPTVLGSLIGAGQQAKEYTAVQREVQIATVARQAEQARAKGVDQYLRAPSSAKDTVTKEEAELLDARLSEGRSARGSFVEQLEANRAQADRSLAK